MHVKVEIKEKIGKKYNFVVVNIDFLNIKKLSQSC